MYAVFDDRGKQYQVEKGQKVKIDLIPGEADAAIEFDRVLLLGGVEGATKVGQPTVSGAKVVAKILDHVREKKIRMVMFKRRKNSRKNKGHRQPMTEILITDIVV